MAIKILPASEVRDKISLVLKQLIETEEPVFITQYSRPKAVLIKYEVYNALMDRLEELEDLHDMAEAEKAYRKGEGQDFEEFVTELKREQPKNISDKTRH